MRVFFLLILLAGIGLGILYPWAATNFSGREIATLPVYDRDAGFSQAEARLASADAPVRVLVDMTALAAPEFAPTRTVLTMTVSGEQGTVLAETMSFAESKPQERNPQLRQKIYRDEVGLLTGIEDGDYTFVVGPGDAEGIDIQSVDIVLRGGAAVLDPRLQPVGYVLSAIGFIGLVLAMRARRRKSGNVAQPGPRWGRGGGNSA